MRVYTRFQEKISDRQNESPSGAGKAPPRSPWWAGSSKIAKKRLQWPFSRPANRKTWTCATASQPRGDGGSVFNGNALHLLLAQHHRPDYLSENGILFSDRPFWQTVLCEVSTPRKLCICFHSQNERMAVKVKSNLLMGFSNCGGRYPSPAKPKTCQVGQA